MPVDIDGDEIMADIMTDVVSSNDTFVAVADDLPVKRIFDLT